MPPVSPKARLGWGTEASKWGQYRDGQVRTRLAIKTHAILERFFPERRLFLRSDNDTRFIRLKSSTQAIAFLGTALVISWTTIATAILLMDSIGAGNFREQAKREQITYQQRLNALSAERDAQWARVAKAEFLTRAEKRSLLGLPAEVGDE